MYLLAWSVLYENPGELSGLYPQWARVQQIRESVYPVGNSDGSSYAIPSKGIFPTVLSLVFILRLWFVEGKGSLLQGSQRFLNSVVACLLQSLSGGSEPPTVLAKPYLAIALYSGSCNSAKP